MKVFQVEGRPHIISFTNYERVSEDVLFRRVVEQLKKSSLFFLGKKFSGPSEEVQECRVDGYSFSLVNDLDYGVEIYSENPEAIQKLLEFFGTA